MPVRSPSRPALLGAGLCALLLGVALLAPPPIEASSHREAPLIADDPLADNTDLYAFVSPVDPRKVVIIANYIPLQLPEGGPNYHHFGEDVRYEIHIKNQTSAGALGSATDDITYRFTFERENEDPTTFFNIRLGAENLNTSYTLEKSVGGGAFQAIITDGATPPAHIGPRSIEGGAGLGTTYDALASAAIETASTGEQVFAGPRDDPFFVDLGGVFDLGGIRDQFGESPEDAANARDGVAGMNVHAIAIQVDIADLQKDGLGTGSAANILDPDFVIGVWASASRPQIRTLSTDGSAPTTSGPWIQVSRLGMPLTNEAVIPIGEKDRWNYVSPYSAEEQSFAPYFVNPELALYMGNGQFGAAVPGLSDDLRIPTNSYPALDLDGDGDPSNEGSGLDFTNGADGAAAVLPLILDGTLDISTSAFGVPTRPAADGLPTALVGPGEPRRVDILPAFYFGVPNAPPYQLATGKPGLVADVDGDGDLDFAPGKPFIHNFLPITQTPDGGLWGGDMLRLNMATPTTDRTSDEFRDWARLGLIRAAAIGLTVPAFANTDLEFLPHMDGFPNGRRLEDDVTGIELQAVGGVVLAAVGLPLDDATAGDYSDLASPFLLDALAFLAGPTKNDVELMDAFPYLAQPFDGYSYVRDMTAEAPNANFEVGSALGVRAPQGAILDPSYPNPSSGASTIRYHVASGAQVRLDVYDVRGRLVETIVDAEVGPGTHEASWSAQGLAAGTYLYRLTVDGEAAAARRMTVVR